MESLTEIVRERIALEIDLGNLTVQYRKKKEELELSIAELKEKESFVMQGFDLEKIELGRKVLFIRGDPYAFNDDIKFIEQTLASLAIKDLLNGCEHLKKSYYGNKHYWGFYQRSDHEYGFAPSHGVIVDEVGLRKPEKPLTDEEIEAAVYYLMVFPQIKKNDNK